MSQSVSQDTSTAAFQGLKLTFEQHEAMVAEFNHYLLQRGWRRSYSNTWVYLCTEVTFYRSVEEETEDDEPTQVGFSAYRGSAHVRVDLASKPGDLGNFLIRLLTALNTIPTE